jgi:hypothetical protein
MVDHPRKIWSSRVHTDEPDQSAGPSGLKKEFFSTEVLLKANLSMFAGSMKPRIKYSAEKPRPAHGEENWSAPNLCLHITYDPIMRRKTTCPSTTTNARNTNIAHSLFFCEAPNFLEDLGRIPSVTEAERSVALAEIRGMRESWLNSRMT